MADAPEKDLARDGLLAIAPRDPTGRPTLGGIPLFKKLGQGGMGAVYLGKHPRLGVEVAVKILPFHLADQDPNAIEYFMREANVAARLNHPSLVRIFDVNVDGDPKAGSAIWYLVMEFVAGQTAGRLLKDRMKSGQGPLAEADALDILLTISDGLSAAHEQKFIHRDIKPENIIIPAGPDGQLQFRRAKLMDLGLAKTHSEDLSLGPTGTNVAMGTPGYMAPEQAENARGAGPPADVFAMGATLYNLLTGSAPFTGTTVLHVLKKTSDEPHAPIRQLNPQVTRPTEALIDTCLAKRPEARYAGAGVLREALKACRQSLDGDLSTDVTMASLQNLVTMRSSDPSLAPSSPAPAASFKTMETATAPPRPGLAAAPRRSKAPLLIAAVVLAAAVVGGFLILKGGNEPKRDTAAPPAPHVRDPGEFDAAMRDAEAAMNEEEYDRAAGFYAKALQVNPKSEAAAKGEARAKQLAEEESTSTKVLKEVKEQSDSKNYDKAWQVIRAAIDKHPDVIAFRMRAARLALEHGQLAWLGVGLNDVEYALRRPGQRRKREATELREKLLAKKKEAELAGGAPAEIQAAIDRADWDAAEKLLEKLKPEERPPFTKAIEQGRRWSAAVDKGKKAETSGQWTDALDAYREALGHRADADTEAAVRRVEQQVKELYRAECDGALEDIRAGRFDDARRRIAAAEKLMPQGLRHASIKDDLRLQELVGEAKRLRVAGKNAEALAAARKALELNQGSAEARALVEQLQKEGPLALAKAALAAGDRAEAARHAREAAAQKAAPAELKGLEAELWADLYVEKAVATARGPVDELMACADGRVVGLGDGFGGFSVWAADDLKPLVTAPKGSRPFNAALLDKDGIRVIGLSAPPGPDGPETQPVMVWEDGRSRALQIETSGLKLPVTATQLAAFDPPFVLRIRWTAGDARSGSDAFTLDALDIEKASAGPSTSDRAQAHASIAVTPSGKYFATGGGVYRTWKQQGARSVVEERKPDTQVYLWSRQSFERRPVDVGEAVGEGALLAFTSDGARLLVATAAKKLFVIDAAGARVVQTIPLPAGASALGASSAFAAVVAGQRVLVVRLDDGRVAPATGLAPAKSVLWSRDGGSLLVGGDDGLLRRYAYEPLAR